MVTDTQRQENIEVWKARAKLFSDRKISVHIKLADGKFLGGTILRFFSDGFDIDDRKLGHYPVSYNEIIQFDKLREATQ